MVIISLWTPLAFDRIAERWFTWPNILYLSPVPLLTAVAAFACWHGLQTGRDVHAVLVGRRAVPARLHRARHLHRALLVPPTLTFWDAAAVPSSQIFMLVGTLIMLPLILGYTVFVYWTFRGKVREGEGYH